MIEGLRVRMNVEEPTGVGPDDIDSVATELFTAADPINGPIDGLVLDPTRLVDALLALGC